MKTWTRRRFGSVVGSMLLTGLRPTRSQSRARVVVIGGGVGGVTVAKYLAASSTSINVTLVEPRQHYTTCFFSNLYLAGLRSFATLVHGYDALIRRHGIAVIHDSVVMIDPGGKSVELKSGAKLSYDRAVVAPGIAFKYDAIDGYDEAATQIIPHAWCAGPQTRLLRQQLEAMEDGGTFVLVAPPDPSRCPPAPYERASLVASFFKRHKPRSKLLIVDTKDSFSMQNLFEEAWQRLYPGMIEWLPAQFTEGVSAVDVKARSVITRAGAFKAAVANVIPPQTAGRLATLGGLANTSGWCPVDPVTFESTLQPGIHVVGDAIVGHDMPKSASAANSQAKACAFAIRAALAGSERMTLPLSNTCHMFLASDEAVSSAITFNPTGGRINAVNAVFSKVEESAEARLQTAREAERWYAAFTDNVFG